MHHTIEIAGQGINITGRLQDHIAHRLHFAVGRFSDQVERIQIKLERVGNKTTECRIHLWARSISSVHVTSTHSRLLAAIDLAADRLGQTVSKRLARRHKPVRGISLNQSEVA